MATRLTLILSGRTLQRHEFKEFDRLVVGRNEDCDVPIDNLGISRQHCEIVRRPGYVQLRDLESAILAHDPALDAPRPAPAAAPSPPLPASPVADRRPALVGRDHELAALVSALDESASDARFAVIEGDPGLSI